MRTEVAQVVERLRDAQDLDLLRMLDQALSPGAGRSPDPDAVEPYRWFVARLGEGVRLTAAGYLPPALVSETMQRFGWDADWFGAGNREDLTGPVRDLRASARQLGLVRVYRGTLLPTATGRRLTENSAGLVEHIGRRLPLGTSEVEQQAGVLWLLAVAAGRSDALQVVGRGLAALGWVDRVTRRPVAAADVSALVHPTRLVFERMGLTSRRRPGASDDAAALARVALLGDEHADAAAPPVQTSARELTVTLVDVEPPIWRRIVVPESLTLREVHGVLQTAMGWRDAHLHLFRVGEVVYGDIEDFPGELGDEDTTTVADVAAQAGEFGYEYDFGDGWEHRIEISDRTTAPGTPHCLAGARACPPEDCGGAPGYERLLAALADPADPEHAELTDWIGGGFDSEGFDVAAVNELLALVARHPRQRRRR